MSGTTTWSQRLEMLIPPFPWDCPIRRDIGGPLVVLLHGLWRSRQAMEPLARALNSQGFSTLNIPYPSTRQSIPRLADHLTRIIERESTNRQTLWVTHSLGGILARVMLSNGSTAPHRLVMLAPPNQGSEIVDHLARWPILSAFLGPAGRKLGTAGIPGQIPQPPNPPPTMVIMGKRSSIPLFRSLLEPENDGIVSVNRGRLASAHDFHVVDADHTYIQIHPDTVRLCLEFFRREIPATACPGAS